MFCNRDLEEAELRALVVAEDEKRRMHRILMKLHEERSDMHATTEVECDSSPLAFFTDVGDCNEQHVSDEKPRLERNDNESRTWLQELENELTRGQLDIPIWEPWWMDDGLMLRQVATNGTALVKELSSHQQGALHHDKNRSPPLPTIALPSLDSMSSKAPAECMKFHLLDLLYSYCLVMRLFNGDYSVDPADAANVALSSSTTLQNQLILDCEHASTILCKSVSKITNPGAGRAEVPKPLAVGLISDVARLLSLGRSGVLPALMHLLRLFESVDGGKRSWRAKKKKATLKIFYFLSLSNELPNSMYSLFATGAEECFLQQRGNLL